MEKKSVNFFGEELLDSTAVPNLSVSIIEDEVPTLTVATIVGLTLFILVAIIVVFLLGVLIDCRQQRLIEKKMGEVKRVKSQRRVNMHPADDKASIANNMEEPGTTVPPAEILRHIP
ncbi:uncharacterized protein LOC119188486 [Manduca sexta]|uniref:Uncharacterized protein n=1 Tax=Manduca sexta TaxID=7130 RepID=A0A922CJR6_MANSE|nr:uncharacterized protein LOC119188486 [Manduca sexta]KAG6449480.1 hypothetical protein O3G_MSEX006097 [Manduca sexta]